MSRFNLTPLFCSPVFSCVLQGDMSPVFQYIKEKQLFRNTFDEPILKEDICSFTSVDKHILNRFPLQKREILDAFEDMKTNEMKYKSSKFEMTTSWATKTLYGGRGHYHHHANCAFSGVLYESHIDGGAPLEFQAPGPFSSFSFCEPDEFNILNSPAWKFTPEQNLLVLFPSSLKHRIGAHLSETPRYSLAFNFLPVGQIGQGDSSARISLL